MSKTSSNAPLLLAIVALLFSGITASATCHAVSPAGAGSKTGADWNNSLAGLPSTLISGDTYYLADSSPGAYGAPTLSNSGGSLVTIKKAIAADHCTDTGWNTSTMGSGQASFSKLSFSSSGSNITFNGNGSSSTQGCGAITGAASSDCGIIIDDSTCVSTGINSCGTGIISVSAGSNVVFNYVEWKGCLQTNSSCVDAEQAFVWMFAPTSGFTLYHVYAHDTGCTYIHQTGGGSRTTTYSYFYNLHTSGNCHGEATYDSAGTSNITDSHNVYRNIVGTSVHWFDGGTNNNDLFYDNVYWWDGSITSGVGDGVLACGNGAACNNFAFNQNTVVNLQNGYHAGVLLTVSGATSSGGTAQNNIWYQISGSLDIPMWGVTEDHNSFLNIGNSSPGGGTGDVIVHSGSPNPFTNWQNGDFTLASESSNWNNRASLSSRYATDAEGKAFTTDRGAYQYGTVSGPLLLLSPSSVTYSNQNVGTTSSAQSLTLSNPGTTSATINSVAFSGTNSGDFSETSTTCGTFPATLSPSGSCTINVAFTPSATGSRLATLIVTDTLDSLTSSASLSGTGSSPNAVAYGGTTVSGKATGSSFTSPNIKVSGSNPLLVVDIGISSTTATVSSVSFSAGGTGVQAISARSTDALSAIWCIPAPTTGTGTVTVNLSTSVAYQYAISLYNGADQTTPCPAGNAVSSTASQMLTSVTPTNLTANDGSSASCTLTVSGNPTGVGQYQRSLDATSAVNLETGDNFGTGGVNCAYDSTSGNHSVTAIRIAAFGVTPAPPTGMVAVVH
jgi:hypothetical protein